MRIMYDFSEKPKKQKCSKKQEETFTQDNLESFINILKQSPENVPRYLLPSIKNGSNKILRYLLYERKVNPNIVLKNSLTPASFAIKLNNVNTLKMLFECGAKLSTETIMSDIENSIEKKRYKIAEVIMKKAISMKGYDPFSILFHIATVPMNEPIKNVP